MAIGLGVSLLIVSTQGTAVWGLFPCPYRVAEADDLITNTTGALLGWLVAWALRDRLPDPNPARMADLGMPGLSRRSAAVFIDLLVLFELILASQLVIELMGIPLPGGTSTCIILTEILVILLLIVVVPSRRSDRDTRGRPRCISPWPRLTVRRRRRTGCSSGRGSGICLWPSSDFRGRSSASWICWSLRGVPTVGH